MGRFYRMLFGGVPLTREHEKEVLAAQQRVHEALKGLDKDVLLLMKATLIFSTVDEENKK